MNTQTDLRRAALLVIVSGLLMLLSMTLMMVMGGGAHKPWMYPNQWGFTNAIVWFELANSSSEVFAVLGPAESDAGQSLRQAIDTTNLYDFGFMVFYSLYHIPMFLFLLLLSRSRSRVYFSRNIFLYVGVALAALMLLGDIMENLQLLQLTQYTQPGDVPADTIMALQIWTRVKWLALFVALFLMSLAYSGYLGPGWQLLIPFLMTMGAILGFIAITNTSMRSMLESGGALMAVGWLSIFAHASYFYYQSYRQTA